MKISEFDLDAPLWPHPVPRGRIANREFLESIADPILADEPLATRTSKLASRALSCSGAYLADTILYGLEAAVSVFAVPYSFFLLAGIIFSPSERLQRAFAIRWILTPGPVSSVTSAAKAAISFVLVFLAPGAVAFYSEKAPLELFDHFNPQPADTDIPSSPQTEPQIDEELAESQVEEAPFPILGCCVWDEQDVRSEHL